MKKKLGKDEICNISGGVGVDSTNGSNEAKDLVVATGDDKIQKKKGASSSPTYTR